MQSLHSHRLTFKQTCPPLIHSLHDVKDSHSCGLTLLPSSPERVFHNELHGVPTCLLSCCCRLLSLLSMSPAMPPTHGHGRILFSFHPFPHCILSRCDSEGRRDQISPRSPLPLPSLKSNPNCLHVRFTFLGTC